MRKPKALVRDEQGVKRKPLRGCDEWRGPEAVLHPDSKCWSDQPEKRRDKELSKQPSPEPRCRLLLSISASGSHVSFKGRQVPVTSGQEVFEEVALGWLRGDPEFSCPLWVSLAAPRPLGQVSPRRGWLAARGRARVDARSASSPGSVAEIGGDTTRQRAGPQQQLLFIN
ncbi:hypothetical protein LEMLEM_LOCUS15241 [Lemmus lemmus]